MKRWSWCWNAVLVFFPISSLLVLQANTHHVSLSELSFRITTIHILHKGQTSSRGFCRDGQVVTPMHFLKGMLKYAAFVILHNENSLRIICKISFKYVYSSWVTCHVIISHQFGVFPEPSGSDGAFLIIIFRQRLNSFKNIFQQMSNLRWHGSLRSCHYMLLLICCGKTCQSCRRRFHGNTKMLLPITNYNSLWWNHHHGPASIAIHHLANDNVM